MKTLKHLLIAILCAGSLFGQAQNKKISELTSTTLGAIADSSYMPIVVSGTTYKVTKGTLKKSLVGNYKSYVARVSQAGTSAPTVQVLENSLGTIVWTYDSQGVYIGTLTSGFPDQNKVFLTFSINNTASLGVIQWLDANSIQIATGDLSGSSLLDDQIGGDATIEIRVYP